MSNIELIKDTQREKASSIKTSTLLKSINMEICLLVHQINSLYEVPIPFALILTSDRAVLQGNAAVSISVLSTKKRFSIILKRVCLFQKISFKIRVIKTFKSFINCHIKTCQTLKRSAILKITSIFLILLALK